MSTWLFERPMNDDEALKKSKRYAGDKEHQRRFISYEDVPICSSYLETESWNLRSTVAKKEEEKVFDEVEWLKL